MAYNATIYNRIKNAVAHWGDIAEKNMFGGICFLFKGHMFCGIYKDFLILRLGEKGTEEALKSKYALPMDITGRPLKSWVMFRQEGFQTDDELHALLEEARDFASTLPAKH
jgi:TfoX/Sxy family transcriptional regulator of competence genes